MSQEEAEIEAPTGWVKCPVCGEIIKSKGKFGHFSRNHSGLNYEEYKDKFVPAEPPQPPARPEGGAPYKVEPDVNAILRDILETSRNNKLISQSVVDEIMDWATRMGSMDPNYLNYLLTGMRGVSAQTANIISSKYAMTLQKAQQEGRVQLPFPIYPPAMPTAPGMFPMFPYQPTAPQPSYWPTIPTAPSAPATVPGMPTTTGYPPTPMPFVTEERLAKILKEREEKSETEKLKERMEKMDRDFAGALTSLKDDIFKRLDEREVPGVQYEEVQEYIDAKGNICHPDKAVSVRVRRVPIREERKTILEQFKELKDAGLITTPKDMMDMLEKRKPAVESVEEHPTVKSMREKLEEYKGALDEYKKDYEKLKDTMADEERKRMQNTITRLEDRITDLTTRGTGEWRTDEMRVISGLLTDIKDLLKERKPITEVKDILVPQGVTPARPPSERAGVEERGGVLEELGKKGLVVRVVERLRR